MGKIYRFTPADLVDTRHSASAHGVNLTTAIDLGRKLGEHLPERVVIYTIEVADVTNFSEKCTPGVERAIPVCAEMVVQELRGG